MVRFAKNIKVLLHAPEWIPYTIRYSEFTNEIHKIQQLLSTNKIAPELINTNREELIIYEVDKLLFSAEKQIESIETFYKSKEKTFQERFDKLSRSLELSGDYPLGSNTMRTLHLATLELYRGLMLLENFSIVNETAIKKILAKYKKLCLKDDYGLALNGILNQFPETIIRLLESTTFPSRAEAKSLAEEIENIFQYYFLRGKSTDEQGRSARMILRHRTKATTPVKSSRTLSWAWALFGAFLVCFMNILFLVIFEPNLLGKINLADLSLLKSTFAFCLTFFLYSLARSSFAFRLINAPFIFELSPGRYIRPEKLLLASSIILLLWSILAQLMIGAALFEIGEESTLILPKPVATFLGIGPNDTYNGKVPLITCFCGVLIWLICLFLLAPWPYPHKIYPKHSKIGHFFVILNRARNRFSKDATSGLCAPFLHIHFTHFFLADVATSLEGPLKAFILALLSLNRWFARGSTTLNVPSLYLTLFSLLPSWVRFAQCSRRLYDANFDNAHPHFYNSMKYQSRFIQFFTWGYLIYPTNPLISHKVVYTFVTLYAQVFKIYWDIFEDWGYMRKMKISTLTVTPSQNPRRNRSLSIAVNTLSDSQDKKKRRRERFKQNIIKRDTTYPLVYYILAPIIDTLIRLSSIIGIWVIGNMSWYGEMILEIGEICRRGMWMLFRVENEHMTNVGQFRATLNLPLPFDTEDIEARDLKNSGDVLDTHVINNITDPTITLTSTNA